LINSSINRTIYDGFEASFTARLPRGANVFGGWSNDRLITSPGGRIRSGRRTRLARPRQVLI
jgi:hypothetical protein